MFLLARLYIDSLLDKRTKAKVQCVLKNLSKGSEALNDAYSEAIVRIDRQLPEDSALAKRVLSWITYAQRPLTTGELCHALAVELGEENLNYDNIPDVEDIVSVCAGLVTVDEESNVIRLVHYTTQEYSEQIREKWNPSAQYDISSTCITYLCFNTFRTGSCLSDTEFER
ncbi:ankyrin repeat protein [Zopfia rhizophila CBS 207.26]|uniref:Ankyrin repeat protein n=1 Tax=Zopfia rhizophila CBS 207.26 TaxID=1314779 RepID=A0A6A6E7T5_9PEZI|nr:ankyrin repeat protein [Zopfia rhizophila CBS 207.26]